MSKICLNNIDSAVFEVKANGQGIEQLRADAVAEGRILFYEFARNGQEEYFKAMNRAEMPAEARLDKGEYGKLNRTFQADHLLCAAKIACAQNGSAAPNSFEDFKKHGQEFYKNSAFIAALQGIYQEIVTPILPAVYSDAVSEFADVVEVGFAETHQITVESNDIPVFQDSAWGASRSVPANRFYSRDYTLNPQPKTAEIRMKWHQLVGNNTDFGRFFANLVAGMYAKTMAMWNAMMTAAASDTSLIPSGLSQTFSSENWVKLANKIAAVNNTAFGNVMAFGGAVALSKVLPANATGSTNVNMDAALATLLGADYIRNARLGEFMSVRLMALRDVIIPGTQNTTVTTMLPDDTIWMMAANGRKPVTIAYNSATPIDIQIDPIVTSSFEYIFNLTTAMDSVAVFSSKIGIITIS